MFLSHIFPFITTGFNWYIAAAIVFLSPIVFVLQGIIIGAIVWTGLFIYEFLAVKLKLTGKKDVSSAPCMLKMKEFEDIKYLFVNQVMEVLKHYKPGEF